MNKQKVQQFRASPGFDSTFCCSFYICLVTGLLGFKKPSNTWSILIKIFECCLQNIVPFSARPGQSSPSRPEPASPARSSSQRRPRYLRVTIKRRRDPKPVISTAGLDDGERHLQGGVHSISISPTNSLSRSRSTITISQPTARAAIQTHCSVSLPIKWAL